MKATRLNPLIIGIVGTILCILPFALAVPLAIKPTADKIAAEQARYDANYNDSTKPAQVAAQKQVDAAVLKVQQTKSQWQAIEARYMPPYDVSNRELAWRQINNELAFNLGPDLEHWVPKTGIVSDFKPKLPAPYTSPNAVSAEPITIDLGTITVVGSFHQILTHVDRWNDFNRLVLIDGLKLDGHSPYMTGSYNAKLIIFPQNDDKLAPPIASAGTGTGGGGQSGFGGGMPGMGGGGMSGGAMGTPGGMPGAR